MLIIELFYISYAAAKVGKTMKSANYKGFVYGFMGNIKKLFIF
jgi:hypothetical protein